MRPPTLARSRNGLNMFCSFRVLDSGHVHFISWVSQGRQCVQGSRGCVHRATRCKTTLSTTMRSRRHALWWAELGRFLAGVYLEWACFKNCWCWVQCFFAVWYVHVIAHLILLLVTVFHKGSHRITVWWLLLKGLMRHKMVMRSIQELTYNYIYIHLFVYLFIFIFICLFRYNLVRGQNPTINHQIFWALFSDVFRWQLACRNHTPT